MAIKGLQSKQLANNPSTPAPKFNFRKYSTDATFVNNSENIDFVTYDGSLYVCTSSTPIQPTHADPIENGGFLLVVAKGEDGKQGKQGKDGADGKIPQIGARFNGGQLEIFDSTGTRLTTSPDLTGKVGKPVQEGSTLSGELSKSNSVPSNIDLEQLRPVEEKPLLLRVDSDNTKRSDEESGPANMIQWKHEGDAHWTNLISISELMNIALAGVSFGVDEQTNKGHFGHKKVISATYDSHKDGEKIISDVELGEVLFDAGALPFMNYELDFNTLRQRISDVENALNSLGSIDLSNYVLKDRLATINNQRLDTGINFNLPTDFSGLTDIQVRVYNDILQYRKAVNGTFEQQGTDILDLSNIGEGDTSNGFVNARIEGTNLVLIRQDNTTLSIPLPSGDSGISESEVKHLIGQILEGVLDSAIPEYERTAGHNYFIRINELNSILNNYYTKSQVYSKGEIDQILNGGDATLRTFMIFKRSGSNESETLPTTAITWNISEGVLDIPSGSNGWTEHPNNASDSTPYLGVAYGTFESLHGSLVGNWDGPFCLTGENGLDGEDGKGIEFIYHRGATAPNIDYTKSKKDSTTNTRTKAWGATEESTDSCPGDGNDGYGTDNPVGIEDISEDTKIEGASIRKSRYDSTNKVSIGEDFCTPFIGSKGGEDGVDGDGVEYIFAVAAENETVEVNGKRELNASFFRGQSALDVLPLNDAEIAAYEAAGGNYQINDGCPDGKVKHGVQMRDLNGTDNPSDVGKDQPYEFVAIRKKKLDPVSGEMKGGPFSTPALGGFGGTTTIYQAAESHFKPYTCFAFTRSANDISKYTIVNPGTHVNQTYEQWIAADNTREDGYYDNPLRYIVTLNENNQVVPSSTLTGNDTIPAPPGQLYMITNHIGDEKSSTDQGGTSPRAGGDASGFQVEYAVSSTETDKVYNKVAGFTLPKLDNYDLDNYPNLSDPDNDGIDEITWRTTVENAGMGVGGDEDSISDPDYMATCYKKQEGVWSNGQISRIKGENGRDGQDGLPGTAGADGTEVEFIYYRTKGNNSPTIDTNNYFKGSAQTNGYRQVADALPQVGNVNSSDLDAGVHGSSEGGNYGHDNPSGVDSTGKYEGISSRRSYYSNGIKMGEDFYTPATVWSKFGENGQDGDGIEYIYYRCSSETFSDNFGNGQGTKPANKVIDPSTILKTTSGFQDKNTEYIPTGGSDDPQGVTEQLPYEGVSVRKYNGGANNGQGEGQEFSQPVIWAKYGKDGNDGAPGTSVSIKGTLQYATDLRQLTTTNLTVGDCYIIIQGVLNPNTSAGGNIYSESYSSSHIGSYGGPDSNLNDDDNHHLAGFDDLGEFANITPNNIYMRFARIATTSEQNNPVSGTTANCTVIIGGIPQSKGITMLPSNTTGPFMGLYTGELESNDITNYKWTKWDGDDYYGLESIFLKLENGVTPVRPTKALLSNSLGSNSTRITGFRTHSSNGELYSISTVNETNYESFDYLPIVEAHVTGENANTQTGEDKPQDVYDSATTKYVCYQSTRNIKLGITEGSDPIIYIPYVEDGEPGYAVFKSVVFKRSAAEPIQPGNDTTKKRYYRMSGNNKIYYDPTQYIPVGALSENNPDYGGTFSDPVPYGGSNEVPSTISITNPDDLSNTLGMTTRVFTEDGLPPQDDNWATPRRVSDTESFDFEFAYKQTDDTIPPLPTTANRHGGSGTQIWFDPEQDVNENYDEMYGEARRMKINGEGVGDWTILRIKGDKGDNGQDAYFLTAVYDEGTGNWATWFDNIRNGVSGYSGIPGELGQKWTVYIGTNILTDTPVTLEQPTMTPALKYLWKTSRTVTYNGSTPSYGTWSVPVLASQTGPKGEDGTTTVINQYQYLDGQVVRLSDWSANSGTKCWNGGTRVGDDNEATGDNTGTLYLDVVAYNGDYYKCVSNTTMGSTTPNNDTTGTGHHWELFAFTSAEAFDTLLANNARINNLTSKQVVVVNDQNVVQGGMTSSTQQIQNISEGNNNNHSIGNIRIGAGELSANANLNTAPFTVTDQGVVTSQGSIETDNTHNGDDVALRTVMDNGLINIDVKDLTNQNSTGITRAKFGYENGAIVLWFFDSNGQELYNLGPGGLQNNGPITPPTQTKMRFYYSDTEFATNAALTPSIERDIYKYTDGIKTIYNGATAVTSYINPFNGNDPSINLSHSVINDKYFDRYIENFVQSSITNFYAADGYYIQDHLYGGTADSTYTPTDSNADTDERYKNVLGFRINNGDITVYQVGTRIYKASSGSNYVYSVLKFEH